VDTAFVTGLGAVISGLLIFIGSAFLLLSLVLGGRLAYFVVASITLCFLLVMGVVWSINKLGPVGQLAKWDAIAAAPDPSQIDKFDPAAEYPEGSWRVADAENAEELTERSELESEATKYLESVAGTDKVEGLPQNYEAAVIVEDSSRLLDQNGELYGATTVEISAQAEKSEFVFVAKFDPGNPLGKARKIAAGIFVLLVLHLFGLSRAERKARQEVQPA
jgi:hypothetical protein